MYGVGICSLWACIAMTAAPPVSGGQEAAFRWVAFVLAIAAGLAEAGFTIYKLQVHLHAQDAREVQVSGSWIPGEHKG
jgi:hypothetical protein